MIRPVLKQCTITQKAIGDRHHRIVGRWQADASDRTGLVSFDRRDVRVELEVGDDSEQRKEEERDKCETNQDYDYHGGPLLQFPTVMWASTYLGSTERAPTER